MSGSGSVSLWIEQLKGGVHEAAQPLWERYFRKLVERVRRLQLIRRIWQGEGRA
jgi:hypothetical protein